MMHKPTSNYDGKPIDTAIQTANVRRVEWQNELIKRDVWQTCLNCSEWSDGKTPHDGMLYPMGCKLHQSLPPIEVVVVGCKDHMCDIPF